MSDDRSGIGRVAVLGAGTMGHGIAQVAAAAGYRVSLHDIDPDVLEKALGQVRKNLEKGVSLGKVEQEAMDRALENLTGETDPAEALAGADLVVEAVPEKAELKRSVLGDAEAAVDEHAVLATNTSSLSIDDLAEGLGRPERFLGLHFFNPVHIMALVEVVRGSATSEATLERALTFVRHVEKEPVVVRDSPGFASSRLGVALGLEAMRMLEEGVASAEDIDTAMELGYRHPMGPLKLTDLVGLDVRLQIADYLHQALGAERFRPPEILRRMVDEGKLGKKTGEGFYDWD